MMVIAGLEEKRTCSATGSSADGMMGLHTRPRDCYLFMIETLFCRSTANVVCILVVIPDTILSCFLYRSIVAGIEMEIEYIIYNIASLLN